MGTIGAAIKFRSDRGERGEWIIAVFEQTPARLIVTDIGCEESRENAEIYAEAMTSLRAGVPHLVYDWHVWVLALLLWVYEGGR